MRIGLSLSTCGVRGASPPINLLQSSQAFDQWTASAVTVTQGVANDPVRGSLTAARIAETTGLVGHQLGAASISFTSGNTYTFSIYCKYETAQFIQMLLGSGAFGANAWGNFDIQNGVVGTIGSSATGVVSAAPGGWYRISLTATATASASSGSAIFCANSGTMTRAQSYTGSASNTRLVADAQVEIGATANQYVPTA